LRQCEINPSGKILILGGNQSEKVGGSGVIVNIGAFDKDWITGYRFPPGFNANYNLPVYNISKSISLSGTR
jgi:hypothetical protein